MCPRLRRRSVPRWHGESSPVPAGDSWTVSARDFGAFSDTRGRPGRHALKPSSERAGPPLANWPFRLSGGPPARLGLRAQSSWRTAPLAGAGGHRRIGLERGRHLALADLGRLPGVAPLGLHLGRRRASSASSTARWMVRFGMSISIRSPSSASAIRPPRPLPARQADRQARRAAGEAPVGDEGAGLSEALRLQIARGIEHFLHARPPRGPS